MPCKPGDFIKLSPVYFDPHPPHGFTLEHHHTTTPPNHSNTLHYTKLYTAMAGRGKGGDGLGKRGVDRETDPDREREIIAAKKYKAEQKPRGSCKKLLVPRL